MKLNKHDELKMIQVHRNNDESESRSLIFKISRTPQDYSNETASSSIENSHSGLEHTSENSLSTIIPEEKNKSLPFDPESALYKEPENIVPKQEVMEYENSPNIEIPYSSVKQEVCQEPRRSLRLVTLKLKLNSSQEPVKISATKSKKRKPRKKSACTAVLKDTRKSSASAHTNYPQIDTTQMRLRSMLLIPTTPKPPPSHTSFVSESNIFGMQAPKFANVDPSRFLSTVFSQGHDVKPPVEPMSFFFIKNDSSTKGARSARRNASKKGDSVYLHYFRKAKKDLSYLRKKYSMLDPITLDNCYGLSNFSVKRTEIMLSDIISGKEVTFPGIENNCTQNIRVSITDESYLHVMDPYSVGTFIPCRETYHQSFERTCSDLLCRKIIVQSMNILYNEEAVT